MVRQVMVLVGKPKARSSEALDSVGIYRLWTTLSSP